MDLNAVSLKITNSMTLTKTIRKWWPNKAGLESKLKKTPYTERYLGW